MAVKDLIAELSLYPDDATVTSSRVCIRTAKSRSTLTFSERMAKKLKAARAIARDGEEVSGG